METIVVKFFDYELDRVLGARILPLRNPLVGGCVSDGDIDQTIQLLKNDLDRLAARMKVAIRKEARGSVFDDACRP